MRAGAPQPRKSATAVWWEGAPHERMSEAEAAAAEAAAAAAAEKALLTPAPAPAPRPSRPSRSGSGGEHVKKKNMTSGQLRREARARGIEVPEDASREEIQRLLDGEFAAIGGGLGLRLGALRLIALNDWGSGPARGALWPGLVCSARKMDLSIRMSPSCATGASTRSC